MALVKDRDGLREQGRARGRKLASRSSPPSSPAIDASSRSASSRRAIAASACETRTRPASVSLGPSRVRSKLHPDLALERRDLLADRRLGEVESSAAAENEPRCATSRRIRRRFIEHKRTLSGRTGIDVALIATPRDDALVTKPPPRAVSETDHEASEVNDMRHDTVPTINSEITIRRMDLADTDRDSVAELADLDSRRAPDGRCSEPRSRARCSRPSRTTGDVIADPFSRTAELRALLETRAVQLRRRGSKPGLRLRAAAAPPSAARPPARSSASPAGADHAPASLGSKSTGTVTPPSRCRLNAARAGPS